MSEPLTKEDFNQWKEDVFNKFVTNEFVHLRDKVDGIVKMVIGNLIGAVLTLIGIIATLLLR